MDIVAEKRTLLGKKTKALRRQGKIPAVVFGKSQGSQPLTLDLVAFEKVFAEAGETTLLNLKVTGEKTPRPVLISEVQRDPVNCQILHINFHEVALTEKTTAEVPIEVIGEAPVVKSGEGIIITLLNEVEVECLPTDIPEKITVDISQLTEVDQGIAIKDLPIDRSKIEIKIDPEELVVKVDYAEQIEAKPKEEAAEEVTEGEETAPKETKKDQEAASEEATDKTTPRKKSESAN